MFEPDLVRYDAHKHLERTFMSWTLDRLQNEYAKVSVEIEALHEQERRNGLENRNWRVDRKIESLAPRKFRLQCAIEDKGGSVD